MFFVLVRAAYRSRGLAFGQNPDERHTPRAAPLPRLSDPEGHLGDSQKPRDLGSIWSQAHAAISAVSAIVLDYLLSDLPPRLWHLEAVLFEEEAPNKTTRPLQEAGAP